MRPDLKEIEYIEDYLLNKLSEADKIEFERKLSMDTEFAQKVELQKLLIQRVKRIGVRYTVATAHKSFMKRENLFYKRNPNTKFFKTFFSLSLILIVVYLVWNSELEESGDTNEISYSIEQPIKGVDMPFQIDTIEAGIDNYIKYESGSSVIIPQNAFVDNEDNPVIGKVVLKFREFNDPIDILLAGIKMNYVFENELLVLESDAMCEIGVYQNNKELKIKKGKELEILQVSSSTSNKFEVYSFDEKIGQWHLFGQNAVYELTGQVYNNQILSSLIEHLHIENPDRDTSIFKEQEKYLQIVEQLNFIDSLNKAVEARNYKTNSARKNSHNTIHYDTANYLKDNELIRRRNILLFNFKNEKDITHLLSFKIDPTTSNTEDFINKQYEKFIDSSLCLLDTNIVFCRSFKINQLGIWNCAQPVKYFKTTEKTDFIMNNKAYYPKDFWMVNNKQRSVFRYDEKVCPEMPVIDDYGNNLIIICDKKTNGLFYGKPLSIDEKNEAIKIAEVKFPTKDYKNIKETIKKFLRK